MNTQKIVVDESKPWRMHREDWYLFMLMRGRSGEYFPSGYWLCSHWERRIGFNPWHLATYRKKIEL